MKNPYLPNAPLYQVATGGPNLAVLDAPGPTASITGEIPNGAQVYGNNIALNGYTMLLDPADSNLILGWAQSWALVLVPASKAPSTST
jgi:hypothetical protein